VAGENLGWFWKGWFLENYKLDQAIVSVRYESDDAKAGALVKIANLGQMAMPVTLAYETTSGKKGTLKLPVEIWNNQVSATIKLPTTDILASVTIDPKNVFTDQNFENNNWQIK
jgi:hypothetical protein